jgi:S-adenosylmethionine:tRNA ribosyltransferase-isomerase
MTLKDFYYDLPHELIAQTPIDKRDCSRLMVVNRKTGEIEHRHFYDIINYLSDNDALILNDSKVIPARIFGVRKSGAVIEVLLLRPISTDCWQALVKPGKKARIGEKLEFDEGLAGIVTDILDDGKRAISFTYPDKYKSIYEVLDKIGNMPLPPYIKEKLKEPDRYQTVYAKHIGSAAAPTAGLHFTKPLLNSIKEKGVSIGYVTLHVGLGTFRPVKENDITKHQMHAESFFVPDETEKIIENTISSGGRIICVGTTAVRTLESAYDRNRKLIKNSGDTSIFIYPGYKFKMVDGLITNFHLPESTLIMLVSAFSSREIILNAYNEAVKERYRFFSFGDAQFII